MNYCKGSIGLIKAVSALFIHKYLYKKNLTSSEVHSSKAYCNAEKYSVVFHNKSE